MGIKAFVVEQGLDLPNVHVLKKDDVRSNTLKLPGKPADGPPGNPRASWKAMQAEAGANEPGWNFGTHFLISKDGKVFRRSLRRSRPGSRSSSASKRSPWDGDDATYFCVIVLGHGSTLGPGLHPDLHLSVCSPDHQQQRLSFFCGDASPSLQYSFLIISVQFPGGRVCVPKNIWRGCQMI